MTDRRPAGAERTARASGPPRGRRAPLWEPTAGERERACMTRFMRWVGEREGRTFEDYEQLREWSVQELERFWASVWEFFGVRCSRPYERVLSTRTLPGARWFEGAELNYAENMLAGRRGPSEGAHDGDGGEPRAGRPLGEGGPLDAGEAGARTRAASTRGDATAVFHASELRDLGELTWGELSTQVAAVAGALRALGVQRGDRVVAYMPNIPETLIAFLATASVGAIFSSAAPEFGARSVIDRFAQIEPKVLLAVDGYRHGGKDFDRRRVVGEILAELPTVSHVVLMPYLFTGREQPRAQTPGAGAAPMPEAGRVQTPGASAASTPGASEVWTLGGSGARTLTWSELCELGATDQGSASEPRYEQVPFDHPLWVLYSSGTTGLPKAIVHSHGGILMEQLKKSHLHLDLQPGDRMFWFTTTGWMMWNFLIGCLFTEAAIVLYDGSPGHPDLGAMWALAERTRMTRMGLSAGLLAACEKAGVRPGRDYDLSALRSIGSTGSPLAPESFTWVYEQVKSDVWLFSTSGGTDVCTAFVGGCPLLPVYEGELQCRALGCAVESWDEQGRSLIDEVGELVLTEPLPSMPLFFWGDSPARTPGAPSAGPSAPDAEPWRQPVGERYRESYFAMYPGVWRHGDWIRITPRGGAVISGRSDATINRQGVRMGTSEIYRAASAVEEVVDALVVDIPNGRAGAHDSRSRAEQREQELRMWLFVVLAPGIALGEDLAGRIRRRIREDCSPRHVPDEVVQIEEVPRTLSGKALEVPVKRILMGTAPGEAASVESLANPGALEYFVQLAQTLR
jgi:acetoacetyl-CoA synthetase